MATFAQCWQRYVMTVVNLHIFTISSFTGKVCQPLLSPLLFYLMSRRGLFEVPDGSGDPDYRLCLDSE